MCIPAEQGNKAQPLKISKHTLWKEVHEKGLISETSTEQGAKRRLAIKRRFGGQLTSVCSFSSNVSEFDVVS
jgi:hypothetical protein